VSILGPLLFILYVNDLSKQLKDVITISFADDTTLYVADENVEDLFVKLYDKTLLLLDWCRANQLSLNFSKTNYILFQLNTKLNERDIPELLINKCKINRVKVITFLGLYIDDKLNWSKQINHICSRLKQNCFLLNNVKYLLPKNN
jgi:hypothetical protein